MLWESKPRTSRKAGLGEGHRIGTRHAVAVLLNVRITRGARPLARRLGCREHWVNGYAASCMDGTWSKHTTGTRRASVLAEKRGVKGPAAWRLVRYVIFFHQDDSPLRCGFRSEVERLGSWVVEGRTCIWFVHLVADRGLVSMAAILRRSRCLCQDHTTMVRFGDCDASGASTMFGRVA